MQRVKFTKLDDSEDSDDGYAKVKIERVTEDELPPKVKYKNILEEEDDFLPE